MTRQLGGARQEHGFAAGLVLATIITVQSWCAGFQQTAANSCCCGCIDSSCS